MGLRLHVARKYEIEYSSSFGFNYKVVEFHNLLTALGISYNGESWDDDVEVNRENFRQGLDKLKTYDKLDAGEKTDRITGVLSYGGKHGKRDASVSEGCPSERGGPLPDAGKPL